MQIRTGYKLHLIKYNPYINHESGPGIFLDPVENRIKFPFCTFSHCIFYIHPIIALDLTLIVKA